MVKCIKCGGPVKKNGLRAIVDYDIQKYKCKRCNRQFEIILQDKSRYCMRCDKPTMKMFCETCRGLTKDIRLFDNVPLALLEKPVVDEIEEEEANK